MIATVALSIIALIAYLMRWSGAGWTLVVVAMLLAIVPASDLSLSILNFDITNFFKPHLLPRMNTAGGVPATARTMVVVPAIFSSADSVAGLVEILEVRFLANEDEHIYFALLGDFPDAGQQELPGDDALLETALSGIERLNARYRGGKWPRFHLFHRRRQWNPKESKWLGWERKRGKLDELNRLLRGATDTSFIVRTADASLLRDVRYVITLDADTQLPRDAARKLVGTAIHP